MKKLYILATLFLSVNLFAQQNVTFSVDMSTYGGSFTSVEVNATWNGFCGACNPLTDQGGGIWSATIPLNSGTYEYKFTIDGGSTYETLVAQEVCTVTNFGFTNRYLEVGTSDITLPTAPWDGCAEDLVNPGPHDVTFEVDMSSSGLDTSAGVRVVGEWNGFDANSNFLMDQGGGIWSATIPLDEKSWQYKFVVGNYSPDEQFLQGDPNTSSSNGPCTDGVCTNRFIQVAQDLTVETTWNDSNRNVLSANSFALNDNLNVYPNPSNNVWNIRGQQTIQSLDVYDVLGKQVMNLQPNNTNVTIDATALPNGLYFARMVTELGSSSTKLIKQ